MITTLMGLPGKVKTLLDRLSVTRAANLENLNVTVSSRAQASTAVSNTVLTDVRIERLDSPILQMGVVKSIQRGSVTLTGPVPSMDVSISAVDLDKSIVFCEWGSHWATSYSGFVFVGAHSEIVNSTTIRIARQGGVTGGAAPAYSVRWTVLEFN